MVTIRDMARQSGVPVATVPRVLNGSALVGPNTHETVMETVTQLGHRPNASIQTLATQVGGTIGVVVVDISDALFGALARVVDMVAQQHQKYVLIGNSYHEAEKERRTIEVLIRQRCNVLIVRSKALSDRGLAELTDRIPGMVLINRLVPGYAHRCICLDNISGVKMAARMLLNNGHQRIGHLASSRRIEDDVMHKEGWLTALQEQRIAAAESRVGTGSSDMQGGESAMVELLGRNLQLMVAFTYDGDMAADVLTVPKDNGIAIPLHLSIIGFNGIPIARYTDPQLTTAYYPIVLVVKMATELTLQEATGTLDPQASHCFMPTLVRRHSIALRQDAAPITNS